MNSELKKQYAMRISQANNVQMIIITYEVIGTYLDEALMNAESISYTENIDMAKRCIDEMMYNLHYEYDLAKNLKDLYLHMKRRLRQAVWENDRDAVLEVKRLVNSLKEAYLKIVDYDDSAPIMQNTQSVITGITYGRNQILDEVSQDTGNRGYRI